MIYAISILRNLVAVIAAASLIACDNQAAPSQTPEFESMRKELTECKKSNTQAAERLNGAKSELESIKADNVKLRAIQATLLARIKELEAKSVSVAEARERLSVGMDESMDALKKMLE